MSRRSTGISTSMALVLASAVFTGPAFANEVANVKSISFKAYNATKPIRVISTDGKKWNKLANDDITFSGEMSVNTRHPGYVSKVGVVLGGCNKNLCYGNPDAWSRQIGERDWSGHGNFAFNTSVLPISGGGIGGLPYGKEIIAACNEHLQADGPTKSYEFDTAMEATFVVDTGIAWGGAGQYGVFENGESTFPEKIDYSRRDSFKVRIICDPVIKSPTNDIAIDQGEFEPDGIKLFLATINGANTDGPNPATKCPALRVTTRVETSKAGGVDIKLWRQEGQGPITSEFKSAYASFDAAKNGYFADFVRTEKFDATTWLQSWPRSSAIRLRHQRRGKTSPSIAHRLEAAGSPTACQTMATTRCFRRKSQSRRWTPAAMILPRPHDPIRMARKPRGLAKSPWPTAPARANPARARDRCSSP